jgi:hypothetical protein
MGRPSRLQRLPPEIRKACADLRENGRTIDEILAHLRKLGVEDVSRSAVGRWTQDLDAIAEKLRETREIAQVLGKKLDDAPESQLGRFNIEMMQAVTFKLILGAQSGDVTFDPKELNFMASALKSLGQADRHQIDLRKAIRAELAAEMKTKVEASIDAAAVEVDKAAALARIRRDVYGIVDAA